MAMGIRALPVLAGLTALVVVALSFESIALAQNAPPLTDYDEATAQDRRFRDATTPRDKELAQYRLAIALYRLRLFDASYGIFSEIADHPNHAEFDATLVWLARLSTDLPEPADVAERVGKYSETAIDNLAGQPPAIKSQLTYLLARFKYRNQRYEDALRLFGKIERSSRLYAKAQYFAGITNVQLRRPVDAVHTFESVIEAVDSGDDVYEEKERLRELSLLSIARTFYSASVVMDVRGRPAIHRVRLTAALKRWTALSGSSQFWTDAVFEAAWAYYMLGDHARALGNIHTLHSVYLENAFNPEVDVLESVVYLANCRYDDAASLTARFQTKYVPIATELIQLIASFDGADQDERLYRFAREVRSGRAPVSSSLARVMALALSDREFLRHLQYVEVIEDEQRRLAKAPATFRHSELGTDITDTMTLVHDIAIRNAAELARERTKRTLEELTAQLDENVRILIYAWRASRIEHEPQSGPPDPPPRNPDRNVVHGDDEHVLWPFTGEYWADEVGTYQQSIRSKCL